MPISLNTVVAQAAECLTADVRDEAVVMAVQTSQYVALNTVGKDIWQRAASPSRVEDICASLAAEYDAPRAEIDADVLEFVQKMVDAGTLVVCG